MPKTRAIVCIRVHDVFAKTDANREERRSLIDAYRYTIKRSRFYRIIKKKTGYVIRRGSNKKYTYMGRTSRNTLFVVKMNGRSVILKDTNLFRKKKKKITVVDIHFAIDSAHALRYFRYQSIRLFKKKFSHGTRSNLRSS